MMTPSSISLHASDAEVNAAVAQHCAGWKPDPYSGHLVPPEYTPHEGFYATAKVPPYSTSADAVLSLLEQRPNDLWSHDVHRALEHEPDGYYRYVAWNGVRDGRILSGHHRARMTVLFARTAAFTLLKAHGVKVVEDQV